MISNEFKEAVRTKDIKRVKLLLETTLTLDLTYLQFDEQLAYAISEIPTLIEKHDGVQFLSKSEWDTRYLSVLKIELLKNFSLERIEKIKEIQNVLYQFQAEEQRKNLQAATSNSESFQSQEERSNLELLISIIASVGVGVAALFFAGLKGFGIVKIATTGILASVVVGGVTYFIVKK